jgi:exopolyphosphatase/pppGpp-phosphohydrolase
MPLTDSAEEQIRQLYAWLRPQHAGDPISVLTISGHQTVLASGDGAEPAQTFVLPLGTATLSADYLRHQPPTAAELENAIMPVEDQLYHARSLADGRSSLFSRDPLLLEVAHAAGVRGSLPLRLSREAVEQTFERLVMVAQGRPAGAEAMPSTAEFSSVLLLLREMLHHLQFDAITLVDY